MDGKERYESLSRPPASDLKKIEGGRLAGMSDIRPQWRIQAMTEAYGLCGIGWRYAIERTWTEDGPAGERMVFVLVSLYVKEDGQWSEAIPGIGGSSLIDKEKGGLRCDDEGYKMALTDALSVAMKAIGVAAAIYMGLWDGTKYKDRPNDAPPPLPRDQREVVKDKIADIFKTLAPDVLTVWRGKYEAVTRPLTIESITAYYNELKKATAKEGA